MTREEQILNGFTEMMKGIWNNQETGQRIDVNDSYNRISCRCLVCGWESHMYEDNAVGMRFCPNCGAKMLNEGEG